MIARRHFLLWSAAGMLCVPRPSLAQRSPNKIYRLGWLSPAPITDIPERVQSIRRALREQGYVEGKNLVIDFRTTEGRTERYPALAAELIALKPDCVLAVGLAATKSMKEATSTIPIVMGTVDADPVAEGLIASLARPGGNITGISGIAWELAGKRLALLKEVYPRLSRVAIVFSHSAAADAHVKDTLPAARKMNLQVQLLGVKSPEEIESAFRTARQGKANGLFVITTGAFSAYRQRVIASAENTRLPAVYSNTEFVGLGGLMAYGPDAVAQFQRAGEYVGRIFKGARPSDLPVQQQDRFQLIVNMKAAKAIGLTIPQSVLVRADRVIE